MKVKYIGPFDGVYFVLPDGREVEVEYNGTVDVSDEVGASLLDQPCNWSSTANTSAPTESAPKNEEV